jgi:hypothetical protein
MKPAWVTNGRVFKTPTAAVSVNVLKQIYYQNGLI